MDIEKACTLSFCFKDELQKKWEDWSKHKYIGYVIMSDTSIKYIPDNLSSYTPIPSWNKIHLEKNFIWEACLYKEYTSIKIIQANDKWIVTEIEWGKDPEKIYEEKKIFFTKHKYLINKNGEKIVMLEAWLPKKIEYANGMEALEPAWSAFIGFEREGVKNAKF